jgi:thermitase
VKKNILIGFAVTFGCWVASAGNYLVKYRTAGGIGVGLTNDVQILDHYEKGKWYKVRIDELKRTQALIGFSSNPNIEYIVPDAPFYPVESFQWWWSKKQWALETVHAKKAWELAGNRGSKSVTVAVIDSGVDMNHIALAGSILPGYDFASNDADPRDEVSSQNEGHGTHCAGVIGATGAKGGTLGMSPEVSILPLRFITKSGFGDMSDAIKAIDYAIEHHV